MKFKTANKINDFKHVSYGMAVYYSCQFVLLHHGAEESFQYSGPLYIFLARSAVRLRSSLASPRLLRSGCFCSLTWGQDGTESKGAAPARRDAVEVAVRRPAVERVVEPTAAPKHTGRA